MVAVTDDDYDAINKQVEYMIEPSSPHISLFRLQPRQQECDVILTGQLDADNLPNDTMSTIVYSIEVKVILVV